MHVMRWSCSSCLSEVRLSGMGSARTAEVPSATSRYILPTSPQIGCQASISRGALAAARAFSSTPASFGLVRSGAASTRSLSSAAVPQPREEDEAPESSAIQAHVGFVGAGNMGGAILKGWMRSGIASPERLACCVRSESSAMEWDAYGMQVYGDVLDKTQAAAIADFSDIIFLGVKPQYLDEALTALAPHVTRKHTVVSIAAGWTLAQLEAKLPEGTAVVRVMPNTPIMVGQGACGYCLGSSASDEDRATVHALLEACGLAVQIEERLMDALTGVSGSGPAYMFLILEAMADGGVASGLPRDKALALAAQTMKGAAEMVLSSSDDGSLGHPGVLKDQVTSPAGTTIEAVAALEAAGVRNTMINAVRTAARRAAEMSSR